MFNLKESKTLKAKGAKNLLKLMLLPIILFMSVACNKLTPSSDNYLNAINVNQIEGKEDIYTALTASSGRTLIGYYDNTGKDPIPKPLTVESDRFSIKNLEVPSDNTGLAIKFDYYDPSAVEGIFIDENTSFKVYITDTKGKILISPSKLMGYDKLMASDTFNLTEVTGGVNPYDPKYNLNGQEFDIRLVYSVSGKQYYIKYGVSFMYAS